MARIRIGVIGSGKDPLTHLSIPLGQWIAEKGFDLVNGGGQGVMAATALAFSQIPEHKGIAIGILPAQNFCDHGEARAAYQSPEGYPNAHIDLAIPHPPAAIGRTRQRHGQPQPHRRAHGGLPHRAAGNPGHALGDRAGTRIRKTTGRVEPGGGMGFLRRPRKSGPHFRGSGGVGRGKSGGF